MFWKNGTKPWDKEKDLNIFFLDSITQELHRQEKQKNGLQAARLITR